MKNVKRKMEKKSKKKYQNWKTKKTKNEKRKTKNEKLKTKNKKWKMKKRKTRKKKKGWNGKRIFNLPIKKYLCPVIIFAENPIEIKKKAKISFLLEILLKMKNEKMKKKSDSLLSFWFFFKMRLIFWTDFSFWKGNFPHLGEG